MTVQIDTYPINRTLAALIFGAVFVILMLWAAVNRTESMPAVIGTISQAVGVLVATAGGMYVFRALLHYARTHPAPHPRYTMVVGGVVTLLMAWLVVVLNFIYPALPVRSLLDHTPYAITDAIRGQAFAASILLNFSQMVFIIKLKERDASGYPPHKK